ncbi:MAG: ABC transporter substrate-binding protein [Verrucomicrobia bacterium]|nr:ABC transporter substrate-binding protein [Verrucomicrobiota bacterium]
MRWRFAVVGWLLLVSTSSTAAAINSPVPPPPSSPPFLDLRQSTLDYHGPSEDFSGLTELRIGWFGSTNLADPLTGDLWWAANHAIQEANALITDHGLQTTFRIPRSEFPLPPSAFCLLPSAFPVPFRLVPRWSIDPWGTGVSQLTRMVYEDQPIALIGSIDSATTHLAEQVVAKANLPLVSPIATDPSVTLAGVPWMFACAPSDVAVARVLVDAVLATLEGQQGRLALLTATDHESRMTTREVLREFLKRQRPPDFRFEVPPGAADITRQLSALADARPAVVLLIAGVEDSARLARAIRSLSAPTATHPSLYPAPPLFASQSAARTRFRELAGDAAEGISFPLLAAARGCTATDAARFTEAFLAAREHPPDDAALLTYDATRLLLEAIRQAGPNRDRVRAALAALSPWQGIAGVIHFDGTGQNTRTNLGMATLRNGCLELSDDRASRLTTQQHAPP